MKEHSWEAQPRPVTRILRAVAAPPVAAGIVFGVTILIAIALVLIKPQINQLPEVPEAPGKDSPSALAHVENWEESPLVVYVSGEVAQPGTVELPPGARVEAALEAAGGVTSNAVLEQLNLARPLIDGEHITVPDEVTVETPSRGTNPEGRINLNRADAALLETLPGIGPKLAERIIAWREEHGGFTSPEDLTRVSGIGEKLFEELKHRIEAP